MTLNNKNIAVKNTQKGGLHLFSVVFVKNRIFIIGFNVHMTLHHQTNNINELSREYQI